MSKTAAVFCCKGLGDGLISMILAHNLEINGFEITVFHPFLKELEAWFPDFSVEPLPKMEKAETVLASFDQLFFFYEKTPEMLPIIEKALEKFPDKTKVLNPIATKNHDYPFWEIGQFEGDKPFTDNLVAFCKNLLKLGRVEKTNGLKPPSDLTKRVHHRRVVIHPTSSREGKNWPKEKYIQLCKKLRLKGFDPAFILSPEESLSWPEVQEWIPPLEGLDETASFIYQSGYMIGNDSGIGHLASCLGIPTITICRSAKTIAFWKPSWAQSRVIHPSSWIPNLKVFRLRDRFWKKFITVKAVEKAFISLL